MNKIPQLVTKFRNAIDIAKNSGDFKNDFSFNNFPRGCCGDTCELLGHFLLENNIHTHYICGWHNNGTLETHLSHAWLATKNHTIIDITGDQFKQNSDLLNYNKAVYIGDSDRFHDLFNTRDFDRHEIEGLDTLSGICQPRLMDLYREIAKYIR